MTGISFLWLVLEGAIVVAADFSAAPGAATAVLDFAVIILFLWRAVIVLLVQCSS